MVLDPRDSAGPSPLLKGSPLQVWNTVEQSGALVDAFDCALQQVGPRFTRQVVRANHLDQARLNRVYFSNSANWIQEVTRLTHECNSALSDHQSVIMELVLHRRSTQRWKNNDQYVKMDADTMANAERRKQIQRVWEEGWRMSPDPVMAWELGWGKVRDLYMEFRLEDRSKIVELGVKQNRLGIAREKLSTQSTAEDIQEYQLLERESCNRRRERNVSWTAGEQGTGGDARRMAKGKSPGTDGLSIEVLMESWEWTTGPCITYTQTVWEDGRIGLTNKTAIVKLLPKSQERLLLRNWRPISLMNLSYKIIGKILAGRLKQILPQLVDDDQTGFVEGRCIMDNVITLKLCQDMTNSTGQPTIFCKLDFEKAFDRVQHEYLWETLRAMNFHHKFISLVQMLVADGLANIQVNGKLTGTFKLQRGVRQGCPISPLLFAVSTQPLMCMLRAAERQGTLEGIRIPKGRPLLHKLFADDSGICIAASESNFLVLKSIIGEFEQISGAKLNLGKSVILPMIIDRTTPWLERTGCRLLARGEEVVYLGCKVGDGIEEIHHEQDLLGKLARKLTQWTNRFLSWPSKILLINHVLRALPIYQFLGIGLLEQGYKKLEAKCRCFLWGESAAGRQKVALIGWDRITMAKSNGGLGIRPLRDVSAGLKMKYICRLLSGETAEWATMARYLLHQEMMKRARGQELRWWSVEEGLLLLAVIPTPKNSTLRHLVKAWTRIRSSLSLAEGEWNVPKALTIAQFSLLLKRYGRGEYLNERVVLPVLKKLKYTTLIHLQNCRGVWKDIQWELQNAGIETTPMQKEEINNLQRLLRKTITRVDKLQDSDSWRWEGSEAPWKGWKQPSKFWMNILSRKEEPEDLSNKWDSQDATMQWSERWRAIWRSRGSYRSKIWLWRVLKQGFFTGERAERIGVSTDPCKRCNNEPETIQHLFWSCRKAKAVWDRLRCRAMEVGASFRIPESLLGTIDEALNRNQPKNPLIHIVPRILQSIWYARNKKIHEGRESCIPIEETLKAARFEVEGAGNSRSSKEYWETLSAKWNELTRLIGDSPVHTQRLGTPGLTASIEGSQDTSPRSAEGIGDWQQAQLNSRAMLHTAEVSMSVDVGTE
ncbi:hypothetical protein R1sor_004898 [Riccia sorocarpa]|uniref:Reverse transcriptase domain-containing protein n=1 Tax=Riccia sorocarpa TaxID=122646 RepID=A0ABD3HIA3_9MARC